jgi:pyrroline-5-carboxylate reductase
LIDSVGIIGVGHLASYLAEGFRRADPGLRIVLSRYLGEKTEELVEKFGAVEVDENQQVVESTEMVLVTTRPGDTLDACRGVSFRPDQVVISTAVGISVESLAAAAAPATAIRAMPLTCSAVNRSPSLLHPDNPLARDLFEMLGTVHALEKEEQFTPASVIAAFYGWIFALLDETVTWTAGSGVPPELARALVLETVRGAAEMGLARPEMGLDALLDSLATPGGITRKGLDVLTGRRSLEAWVEALDQIRDYVGETH